MTNNNRTTSHRAAIPAALLTALTGPLAYGMLERWEGNVLRVYADRLAGGIPTWCAGQTEGPRPGPVGTRLTDDQCRAINKTTLLDYGFAVLGCTNWDHITADRLVALTIFAVNVGKAGACQSQAVKHINDGQIEQGCKLIATRPDGRPNWSNAGGIYVQGLQNRRQAERELCLKGTA